MRIPPRAPDQPLSPKRVRRDKDFLSPLPGNSIEELTPARLDNESSLFLKQTNNVKKKQVVIVKNHNSNDMRVPSQKVSKSIIVHQHRNAHVIQSYGRYNDVMSHENFDQEYYEKPEKVEDLYNLDESI